MKIGRAAEVSRRHQVGFRYSPVGLRSGPKPPITYMHVFAAIRCEECELERQTRETTGLVESRRDRAWQLRDGGSGQDAEARPVTGSESEDFRGGGRQWAQVKA